MRDPERIPLILAAVERHWRTQPDVRLGQLLVNLIRRLRCGDDASALFSLEDGRLLELLGPETELETAYVAPEPGEARRGWREWERDAVGRHADRQRVATPAALTNRRLIALGERLDEIELAINDVHRETPDDASRDLVASLMNEVQRARWAALSLDPAALGMRAEGAVRLWVGHGTAPDGWRQVTRFADATRLLADSVVELAVANDLDDPDHWGVHAIHWLGAQPQRYGRGVWPRDGITITETRADQRAELARAIEQHAGRELRLRRTLTADGHDRFIFSWDAADDHADRPLEEHGQA